MTVKIKSLAYGTEFTYAGQKYRKESTLRGNKATNFKTMEYRCSPKLGGQWQNADELQVWLDDQTEVQVN